MTWTRRPGKGTAHSPPSKAPEKNPLKIMGNLCSAPPDKEEEKPAPAPAPARAPAETGGVQTAGLEEVEVSISEAAHDAPEPAAAQIGALIPASPAPAPQAEAAPEPQSTPPTEERSPVRTARPHRPRSSSQSRAPHD